MYCDKKVSAIIVAAGKGTRIGFDKMLYKIDGIPVVERSVRAFQQNALVDSIVVVAGDNIEDIKQICTGYDKVAAVVKGGSQRAESVANGLAAITSDGLVAVHDGARPFVSDEIITETITTAAKTGAAIPC
ncbi:MAG: 2-C-methyl-D-erythritol 4-phosphate cytidylyltransferase, partial [Oscillospiraceae bacterium]|nr:2-C-methyl-D-erythritol 4-phosphate cytidylyltransferase [Oscillospiraceae bacterium]